MQANFPWLLRNINLCWSKFMEIVQQAFDQLYAVSH